MEKDNDNATESYWDENIVIFLSCAVKSKLNDWFALTKSEFCYRKNFENKTKPFLRSLKYLSRRETSKNNRLQVLSSEKSHEALKMQRVGPAVNKQTELEFYDETETTLFVFTLLSFENSFE